MVALTFFTWSYPHHSVWILRFIFGLQCALVTFTFFTCSYPHHSVWIFRFIFRDVFHGGFLWLNHPYGSLWAFFAALLLSILLTAHPANSSLLFLFIGGVYIPYGFLFPVLIHVFILLFDHFLLLFFFLRFMLVFSVLVLPFLPYSCFGRVISCSLLFSFSCFPLGFL